ncbi:hypothetical protein [Acetobacter oryzoeni]|uniref:Uncharacterized protein n=1 Tax=Acetobacter oryzoeni TaxID=2500548 RepID=A0A5B9GLQ4_9PROT|nr:hypothetical protein [Acetobacter oryzoeni]MCP1202748.1 hypothetical protein [Acetobacter oryzoeni]QEE84525.1 hypothetical protein EOV40_001750 [Acetobacter oryzoeni]
MTNADVKTAYPNQYYGKYDSTSGFLIIPAFDIWNGVNSNGQSINDISTLPVASDMIALTAAQMSLIQYGTNTGYLNIPVDTASKSLKYPDRYYCDESTPAAFYDMWGFSRIPTISNTLHAVVTNAWDARMASALTGFKQQVWDKSSNQLVDYVPPVVVIPLKTRAATALASARTYVNNNYTILNEPTPDAWVAYLKALMSIANGSDTTSTALPVAPTTS